MENITISIQVPQSSDLGNVLSALVVNSATQSQAKTISSLADETGWFKESIVLELFNMTSAKELRKKANEFGIAISRPSRSGFLYRKTDVLDYIECSTNN